eukprot:g6422.t1
MRASSHIGCAKALHSGGGCSATPVVVRRCAPLAHCLAPLAHQLTEHQVGVQCRDQTPALLEPVMKERAKSHEQEAPM